MCACKCKCQYIILPSNSRMIHFNSSMITILLQTQNIVNHPHHVYFDKGHVGNFLFNTIAVLFHKKYMYEYVHIHMYMYVYLHVLCKCIKCIQMNGSLDQLFKHVYNMISYNAHTANLSYIEYHVTHIILVNVVR